MFACSYFNKEKNIIEIIKKHKYKSCEYSFSQLSVLLSSTPPHRPMTFFSNFLFEFPYLGTYETPYKVKSLLHETFNRIPLFLCPIRSAYKHKTLILVGTYISFASNRQYICNFFCRMQDIVLVPMHRFKYRDRPIYLPAYSFIKGNRTKKLT